MDANGNAHNSDPVNQSSSVAEPEVDPAIIGVPRHQPWWRAWLFRAASLLWVVVLGWALYQLHREWSGFRFSDLHEAFTRIGPSHLLMAIGFTLASYLCNALLGMIGQRWLNHPLPAVWRDLLRNYIVSAFSMNAGGSVVGGGSIRLRFAAEHGISPAEVGKVTLFSGLAGWAGHAMLCGILLIFTAPPLDWLPSYVSQKLGIGLTVLGVLLLFGSYIFKRSWPNPVLATFTMLVSILDWFLAGMAMWALFPGELPITLGALIAVVALSQALATLTHVPGGIGVLELALTKALAGAIAAPVLTGMLVTYRLIFYLFPFAIAIVLLGAREVNRRKEMVLHGGRIALKGWIMIAPRLAALLALGGGFMLLLSANTPMEATRRGMVGFLPLPFIEASHFISSLTGALLIVLARGLQRRVRAAWWLSVLAMAGGSVFSILKGLDWEEALVMAFMLTCLISSRGHFYRDAGLWTHRFTPSWWALLLSLLGIATWVGFFTARHVPYQSELWWEFAMEGDASRFLRAMVGAGCVLLIAGVAQALRPSKRHVKKTVDWVAVERVLDKTDQTDASLAWLGDKEFVFSKDGDSALMYADQGRSRIVMGDLLGDSSSQDSDDLLWSFIEQAQDEGMRPVFYQITVDEMPRLVDMGMKLYKLGENASVPLDKFTLEGSKAARMRQARSKFQRLELKFAIWTPEQVAANMSRLREVSDAWMAGHRAGEKGFSLGRFDEKYLSHFNFAVVFDAQDHVIAFANLWTTTCKTQLSIDLMRHLQEAPNGVMEGMFVEIMLWGQQQGYKNFSMGMAPLSGLSTHPYAPLWNRLGTSIFQRGNSLYNFTGLRAYKEKFNPEWEPRYIAVPSAWSLPTALIDVTTLIGGGLKKTLARKKG